MYRKGVLMATLNQIRYENLAYIKECTKPNCYKLKHRYGYCILHADEFEGWRKRNLQSKMNAPFTAKGYKLAYKQTN